MVNIAVSFARCRYDWHDRFFDRIEVRIPYFNTNSSAITLLTIRQTNACQNWIDRIQWHLFWKLNCNLMKFYGFLSWFESGKTFGQQFYVDRNSLDIYRRENIEWSVHFFFYEKVFNRCTYLELVSLRHCYYYTLLTLHPLEFHSLWVNVTLFAEIQ